MNLENAISAHFADTNGIVTNWILIAATTDGDDGGVELNWVAGQPRYISLGLIESAKIILKHEAYFGVDE